MRKGRNPRLDGCISVSISCDHCDKIFTGDKRNVYKLSRLHSKYSHGIDNTKNIEQAEELHYTSIRGIDKVVNSKRRDLRFNVSTSSFDKVELFDKQTEEERKLLEAFLN